MCITPLTEAELSAYRRHPDTFFGVVIKQGGTVSTVVEIV